MLLSQLPLREKSTVSAFDTTNESVIQRMRMLGFCEGIEVEVLHCGFPARNPLAVRVGDHTIALGKDEASLIEVQAARDPQAA